MYVKGDKHLRITFCGGFLEQTSDNKRQSPLVHSKPAILQRNRRVL